MLRDDGKRPDGATLVPWKNGAVLVWDFTCVNRQAQSNLSTGLEDGPTVANHAEFRKRQHYSGLPRNCMFEPIAVEHLGGIGSSTYKTLSSISYRIKTTTGEKRSFTFLKQRLGIALQRGNAACSLEALEVNSTGYKPTAF